MAAIEGEVRAAPRLLLRLEGLALGALGVWLFAQTGLSWWVFAGLFLLPDLAMIGYLAGPRLGAALYNAAHTVIGPVLLGAAALSLGSTTGLAVAAIWACHVEFDRALGYGLKYATRFGDTHLGAVGDQRTKK